MFKSATTFLFAIPLLVSPALAQGLGEGIGIRGAAAGLGSGAAAGMNHGDAVVRSANSVIQVQQAAFAQTRAIEQSMKLGCQSEAKKDWNMATKYFEYVLQVVALRDGPGSPKGLPALQHLVTVSKAQNNVDQAISYQKTVVAFTKASPTTDADKVFNAQTALSDLYLQKNDYWGAEPVVHDTVALLDYTSPSIPLSKKRAALADYAKVLRSINKEEEAQAIEKQLADIPATDNAKSTAAPDTTVILKPSIPVQEKH